MGNLMDLVFKLTKIIQLYFGSIQNPNELKLKNKIIAKNNNLICFLICTSTPKVKYC